MYNTNYECRYYKNDIILEISKFTDDEKEYIRDIMYKEDLINIFYLKESDSFDCLNDILSYIYEKVKNNLDLKECMDLSASRLLSKDEQFGLCILYSYDFMYLTHPLICELLETGVIKSCEKLKNTIMYF